MRKIFGRSLPTAFAAAFGFLIFATAVPEWGALVPLEFSPEAPSGQATPSPSDEAAIERLRQRIAGHETEPAGSVFKNVTVLKGMPAGRLLGVMSLGFSRALGVGCMHCHDAERWESDDKPAEQIARDMWTMTNAINAEQLKRIEGLKGRDAVVNCTTCHRGQLKPALNLAPTAR